MLNMSKQNKSLLYQVLKTARPRQWIKNLSLYASLIFSGFFFYTPNTGLSYFTTVSYAFLVFCLLTSSIYFINDIFDYESDRQHPFKKKRPIASGMLAKKTAIIIAIVGLALVIFFSMFFSSFFRVLVLSYLLLQLAYSSKLKNIPIIDVVSIATGFLIRIYAGAVVVDLHMSVWFLLTVVSASLFLAVGKRQSERTLLMQYQDLGNTRKTLKRYSQRLLDQYTGIFATATWLTYALFTFQNEVSTPRQNIEEIYTFLPRTLHSQKLLMISVPLVIFGVMRYLQLVYESNQGESPERVLLNDKPLLITTILFGLIVMTIIYLLT